VSFRDQAYTVPEVEALHCDSCGEVFFAPGQSDALQRAASDLARRAMGLVTGAEIAGFRTSQGLTQAEFEAALGVPPKTVARWEIGSVLQSRAADRFLRVLIAHPALVKELPTLADSGLSAAATGG
jgi:putative zinc finger/helix-turn-helix YgiT family protein